MKNVFKIFAVLTIVTGGVLFAVSCSENNGTEDLPDVKTETTGIDWNKPAEEFEVITLVPGSKEEKEFDKWLESIPVAGNSDLKGTDLSTEQLPAVGGDGGHDPIPFNSRSDCNGRLSEFIIWSEQDIDAIQMVFRDVNGGGITRLDKVGGTGGSKRVVRYGSNQSPSSIKVHYNKYHETTRVVNGMEIGGNMFGRTGENSYTFNFNSNSKLIGHHGQFGDVIDNWGPWVCNR